MLKRKQKGSSKSAKSNSPPTLSKQISDGNAENIVLFIESGMNVETADSTGETSLMKAIKTGKGEIVKALLDGGADPKKVNAEGVPPLIQAIRSHQVDAARSIDCRRREC